MALVLLTYEEYCAGSRTRTSNYTPEILWGVITPPPPTPHPHPTPIPPPPHTAGYLLLAQHSSYFLGGKTIGKARTRISGFRDLTRSCGKTSLWWIEAVACFVKLFIMWNVNQIVSIHDDVIKWKPFPRYWPFVRRIHRWPVNSPHKG